ncbi:MAG: glycosyltransferase family 2 protein [Solirubrobacteraceae bacterium]
MSTGVTVAIPTLNAGAGFSDTLVAVRAQRVSREVQLLICDSGSSDETLAIAHSHEADVIRIPRESFSHGGTRNRPMEEARGDHVAFLTQDSVPASTDWLARLLAGFTVAPDVGLVFGPYRPRPGASVSVARELTSWFASFSADGPRIDALDAGAREAPARHFLGHLGFFTDANGCVARAAWREVPFREIAYAEDHLLAQDMLRAGYAKVYVPDAPVVHSHEYSAAQWFRRSFDEARAVREVYGWALDGRSAVRNLRGGVAGDWRWARAQGDAGVRGAGASLLYHGARAAGGLLGGHAARLPTPVVARLSLEGRV